LGGRRGGFREKKFPEGVLESKGLILLKGRLGGKQLPYSGGGSYAVNHKFTGNRRKCTIINGKKGFLKRGRVSSFQGGRGCLGKNRAAFDVNGSRRKKQTINSNWEKK